MKTFWNKQIIMQYFVNKFRCFSNFLLIVSTFFERLPRSPGLLALTPRSVVDGIKKLPNSKVGQQGLGYH